MKLLTTIEVAKLLNIKPRQVQKYCKRGDLGQRIGGRYLVTEEQLEKFIKPKRGRKVHEIKQ